MLLALYRCMLADFRHRDLLMQDLYYLASTAIRLRRCIRAPRRFLWLNLADICARPLASKLRSSIPLLEGIVQCDYQRICSCFIAMQHGNCAGACEHLLQRHAIVSKASNITMLNACVQAMHCTR